MEAQAQAHKLAAQHAANAALRGYSASAAEPELDDGIPTMQPESPPGGVLSSSSDEPTDLTLDAEEKALRIRDRMEREHRFMQRSAAAQAAAAAAAAALIAEERDREQHEPRPSFDFRHLIPQVSLKTGDNF
jgi:hypothetical protein